MLGAKIGWNWPNGSSEEDEIEKSVQREGRTDRQTDRWTMADQKSSPELVEKLARAFSLGGGMSIEQCFIDIVDINDTAMLN